MGEIVAFVSQYHKSPRGNVFLYENFVKFNPCAVANMLEVFEGNNFGCKVCISFHVGLFLKFDSAPESIKKSTSRSGN